MKALFVLGLLLSWPSISAAVIGFSARVNLPQRESLTPSLTKLAVGWSPLCKTPPERAIEVRSLAGPLPLRAADCNAELPQSTSAWDTAVARFWTMDRLWTVEIRESADLFFGLDETNSLRFDLSPAADTANVDHVTFSNVRLVFAPDENPICSSELFAVAVKLHNARLIGHVCEIDRVELTPMM